MNIKENSEIFFVLFFSIIILFSISSAFAQEKLIKNVLILNSYHKGFVQTDNIVKGIESILEPKKNCINLIIEYMDSKAIEYGIQYKEKLYDLYNYKYGNQKFDLIISSDDNAFDFLREYHKDLFPDTPIVFCGVNNLDAPNLIDHNVFTGILEVQSVRETIDLALSLHPKTRKIVFIVDNTPTGLYFWSMAQKLFKYYEDIRMIHFDSSFSMEQIENKVSRLSDDTILYFGTFHRDKDGKYYSYDEAVSRVAEASSRPMFGNSIQILPYGIVGGKLFSGFYHGQVTAELAQRILKGDKVRDIPVQTEPQTQYMFNYEKLELWNIDISDLPDGSIIINKPFSFYEENKILIWSVIAFVALQMLIIITLMMNIKKRRKAEKSLKESEEKFKSYVESAPFGIFVADEKGNYVDVNEAACRITGYSRVELLNKNLVELIPPEDQSYVKKHFETVVKTGISTGDMYFIKKDGSKKTWTVDAVKLSENCFLGFVADITERKKTEDEIKKHREHLEELVKERTAELEEKNKELERFNNLFVDREFRIKELRDKVKELEKRH